MAGRQILSNRSYSILGELNDVLYVDIRLLLTTFLGDITLNLKNIEVNVFWNCLSCDELMKYE